MEKDFGMVSIVIPVHNAEKFIIPAVDSIRNQTYTNWQLILVDDGSKDNSGSVIDELAKDNDRILAFHTSGVGAAEARNLGTTHSDGRFLAFLDADDLWAPEKLEHELFYLTENDGAFAFTGYEFADEFGVGNGKIVHPPKTLTYKEALKNTTIFTSTVLFDLSKLTKEELMMPKVKSEDTALWWRILRSGVTAYGLDENLVVYRRAGKSLSSNKLEAVRRIWNLYRKVEGLSVIKSCYYFVFWGYNAVARRV
ncbi:MAG: glycosyltransferase family 2 protein [Lachnospiraceae bacterium]|jgi:teichuronic acid biosynthesis glycosyltransferase TuaG|nr:glycosyltransferase family 2 protein [Lachnospiraceae bacterium]